MNDHSDSNTRALLEQLTTFVHPAESHARSAAETDHHLVRVERLTGIRPSGEQSVVQRGPALAQGLRFFTSYPPPPCIDYGC